MWSRWMDCNHCGNKIIQKKVSWYRIRKTNLIDAVHLDEAARRNLHDILSHLQNTNELLGLITIFSGLILSEWQFQQFDILFCC